MANQITVPAFKNSAFKKVHLFFSSLVRDSCICITPYIYVIGSLSIVALQQFAFSPVKFYK